MNEIFAIAESVWRRILGMKVVYFLVACAIMEIFITTFYKYLMANEERNLMVDLSHLLTTLGGLLCVLALAFDIPRELREGTATTLLAKPLGRTQYLVGKYFGISITALVVTALIATGFCIVHRLWFGNLPIEAVKGHMLTVMAVLPMAAVALLWSSVLNEAAASILTTLCIWLLHSVPLLEKAKIVYGGLVVDMDLFNMRAESTYGIAITWSYIGVAAVYAVVYSIGIISVTGILFNQRDLK